MGSIKISFSRYTRSCGIYTQSQKIQNNQYKVAKEIVELIHVEGDNAYISGTISTGDMVVSGGAEKVIENEILKVN